MNKNGLLGAKFCFPLTSVPVVSSAAMFLHLSCRQLVPQPIMSPRQGFRVRCTTVFRRVIESMANGRAQTLFEQRYHNPAYPVHLAASFIGSLAPKERRLPVPDFKNLIRSCTQTIAAESFLVSLRIADTEHDQAKLLDAERKTIFSASRSREALPLKSLLTCTIDGAGIFPSLKSFCEGVAKPLWASILPTPKSASECFVYKDPVEVLLSFWSILQTQCVVVPESLNVPERYELWNDIFDITVALCIVQACMVLGDHAGGKIYKSKSSDAAVDESLSASVATASSVKTKGGEGVVFPRESLGPHESLQLFYQQILIVCGVGADDCQHQNKNLEPEHFETIAKELETYIGHVRRQLLLIHSVLLCSSVSSVDSSDNASVKEDLRSTPLSVLFSSHADDVSTRFQRAYRRVLKSLFEEVKNARVSQSEIPSGSLLELIRGWLPCKDIRPARCSLLSRVPLPMVALPTQLNTYFQRMAASKCHSCGSHPSEPAVCLLCGMLLSVHDTCCSALPNCTNHMKEKHGGCGAIMCLRSEVVLIRNEFSCKFPSPYANEYGEEDPRLRMGLRVRLRPKRLNMLRKLIARHKIGQQVTQVRSVNDRVYRLNYF